MIGTCLYINISLRDTLNQSAKRIGLSRNALTHLLFSKILLEKRLNKPHIFTRVKYQDPDPEKKWKQIGIDFSPEMFEKCMDLRKVLKLSVSFLLAYAIRTYLNQIIMEFLTEPMVKSKSSNNYKQFYLIQAIYHDGINGFHIQWIQKPQEST